MNRPNNPDNHPIYVGTTGSGVNGLGAFLTGGGVWTDVSTRTVKDRFQKLSPREVLAKVRRLPVEGTREYHIGPYAEDFYDVFGTGIGNKEDAAHALVAAGGKGV